ncbi:hypothetical protein K7G98_27275, partial [Saccharothrix sp. MB29]|nr:hypothetical protein [Saccharothrix sp. MB29]
MRLHLAKALGIYGGTSVAAEFADQVGLPPDTPASLPAHDAPVRLPPQGAPPHGLPAHNNGHR